MVDIIKMNYSSVDGRNGGDDYTILLMILMIVWLNPPEYKVD